MEQTYKKLLTYAYNIVGCYEDAKDMVQDALEKYTAVDKTGIDNESNYLIKTVVNTAINFKNRQDRQKGYGVWLPAPIATEHADVPIIREQTAGYSLLVLMEQLNARERAVFILKEAFDYGHQEIAATLDISPANSRQLLARSKKTLKSRAFQAAPPVQRPVLDKYIQTLTDADIKGLKQLLVEDIRLMADGGKKVKVVKDIVIGKDATAHLLQYVYALFLQPTRRVFTTVNHQPAICFYRNGRIYACQVLELNRQGKICNIYSIIDPQKLQALPIKA